MPPGRALLRWVLPDAAAMIAMFAFCWILFTGEGGSRLFRDSDTGWHIRTGEALLRGAPLPRSDPYSFSKPGAPWVAWEWGADVLMGLAHRADGLRGVALLFACAGAFAVWLWVRLHWLVGGNFFLACAMAAPLVTTMGLHWLARPHVFGWVLAAGWLYFLECLPSRRPHFGVALSVLAAAVGILWANLHASFFLLPGMAAVYAAGGWLRRVTWGAPSSPEWYVRAGVCAAAGTFVNPYGWHLHAHVGQYLADSELLKRIGEFQSFNYHAEGAAQILATVGLATMGATLALGRGRVDHFLLAGGIALLGIRSARVLPLAALLALPLVNGALTAALRYHPFPPLPRRWLDAFLGYSDRLRALESQAGGYLSLAAIAALAFVVLHAPSAAARMAFPSTEFPVEAAAAVDKLPTTARLLAPDKFGGYLIYRFNGQRKVFFDGRSDFYGLEFLKRYIRLMEARPGWRAEVESFGFTHALLPVNYSLVAGLTDRGWRELYRDETAILLARN